MAARVWVRRLLSPQSNMGMSWTLSPDAGRLSVE